MKAQLSLWDPGTLLNSVIFSYFFCHKCTSSPYLKLNFPSGAFFLLWGTHSVTKMQPGFELASPLSPGPSSEAVGMALSSVGYKECFSLARFYYLL